MLSEFNYFVGWPEKAESKVKILLLKSSSENWNCENSNKKFEFVSKTTNAYCKIQINYKYNKLYEITNLQI